MLLDEPYEKYSVSNLFIAYGVTKSISTVLGLSEVNISKMLARSGVWIRDLKQVEQLLAKMPIAECRRFEILVGRK